MATHRELSKGKIEESESVQQVLSLGSCRKMPLYNLGSLEIVGLPPRQKA